MGGTLKPDKLLVGKGVSRRKFVTGVGAAVAGAALFAAGGQVLTNGWLFEVPGRALVRSTFARYLGQEFQIRSASGGALALKLVAVRDLSTGAQPSAPATEDNEQSFSLLFRGPGDRRLDQDIYRFEHDGIGRFSLFIVPMSSSNGAQRYEAIFNRI